MEPGERRLPSPAIPRDLDDAGAHRREPFGRDLPDARGGTRNDDGLALRLQPPFLRS